MYEQIEERLTRLYGMGGSSSYLVANTTDIDWSALQDMRPHGVIRVRERDVGTKITFLPGAPANLEGCIAGWISDEA